jgi:hypothetical protein
MNKDALGPITFVVVIIMFGACTTNILENQHEYKMTQLSCDKGEK